MDRLSQLTIFVAVARAESFGAAAHSLGRSSASISRSISDLEDDLGVRLLHRTSRTVKLTEQGRNYYDFARVWLADLERQDSTVRGDHARAAGTLSIVAPMWIGSLDLSDAIAAFAEAYPRIDVRFDIGEPMERTYDFIEAGYDIAFHTKELPNSEVKIRQVSTLRFVLCASPLYLRKHPAPKTLQELRQHSCLLHHIDPVWHLDYNGDKHHFKVPTGGFSSNTYMVLSKAVLEGLGIAQLPHKAIRDEITSGRLEIVLADHPVSPRPLYIIYPPGLQAMRKCRVFVDFMAEWFKRFPADADSGTETKLECAGVRDIDANAASRSNTRLTASEASLSSAA